MIEGLYKRLSHPYGIEKPSSELKEAIKILNWRISAWQVISASITLMIISTVLIVPIFAILILRHEYLNSAIVLTFPIMVYFLFTEYPKYIAKAEISKEIGEVPLLISELAILLKQNPNIENAISQLKQFNGKIFDKLKEIEIKLQLGEINNVEKALINLSERYENIFPEFKRSLILILNKEYDRGIQVCINGISNRIEEFTNKLTIPTLIIFSIGAIFPLVFISLLPTLSFLKIDLITVLSTTIIAAIFTLIYSNITLAKRPIVFANYEVQSEKKPNPLTYILIGTIISTPAILYAFGIRIFPDGYNLIWLLIGATFAISLYAYKVSSEAKEYREYLKNVEDNVTELSYKLAARSIEGKPLDDFMWKRDFSISSRMQMLKMLIKNTMSKGTNAMYTALVTFGDYLSNIDSTKNQFFNRISNTIEMMKLTVVLFLPLISAISVAIGIELNNNATTMPFFNITINISQLTIIAGMYTMITTLLILRYITYLKNGHDKIELYDAISKYLPLSLGIFILGYSIIPGVI